MELLFAAGQKVTENKLPDRFFCVTHIFLMSVSKVIRKHLLEVSQVNLFVRVPKLGLPRVLQEYLLYNVSLSNTD